MTEKSHEFSHRGTILEWRPDRGYGEIEDEKTGTRYRATNAGNKGEALNGGVSLDGIAVRFRVRRPYQPVEWISESQVRQREEAARQKEAEEQKAFEQKAAEQRAEDARRKEAERQRAAERRAETARRKKAEKQRAEEQRAEAARLKAKEAAEEEEFRQLVEEISVCKFTSSSQVSRYIVDNRLGHKYRHISGILQMEKDGVMWDFNGGFPPKLYARLCEALGLGNQGSRAVPVAFTPYNDIFDGEQGS